MKHFLYSTFCITLILLLTLFLFWVGGKYPNPPKKGHVNEIKPLELTEKEEEQIRAYLRELENENTD